MLSVSLSISFFFITFSRILRTSFRVSLTAENDRILDEKGPKCFEWKRKIKINIDILMRKLNFVNFWGSFNSTFDFLTST